MHILNEEYKISKAFLEKPWKKLTYLNVRKLCGKKSKGYIYRVLNNLLLENILQREKVGKSILYALTLNYFATQSYLGSLHEYLSWQEKHVPNSIVNAIAHKICRITPFFVFIVAGSYAKKKQTKNSDLDVAIICDNSTDPKEIIAEIKLESDLSIPQVHPFVFTKDQFLEMLVDEGENYGKEVARNNLIFFGGAVYYNILNEGIKHGFRG